MHVLADERGSFAKHAYVLPSPTPFSPNHRMAPNVLALIRLIEARGNARTFSRPPAHRPNHLIRSGRCVTTCWSLKGGQRLLHTHAGRRHQIATEVPCTARWMPGRRRLVMTASAVSMHSCDFPRRRQAVLVFVPTSAAAPCWRASCATTTPPRASPCRILQPSPPSNATIPQ